MIILSGKNVNMEMGKTEKPSYDGWVSTKSTPSEKMKDSFFRVASFSCDAAHHGQKMIEEAAFQPLLRPANPALRNKNEGALRPFIHPQDKKHTLSML